VAFPAVAGRPAHLGGIAGTLGAEATVAYLYPSSGAALAAADVIVPLARRCRLVTHCYSSSVARRTISAVLGVGTVVGDSARRRAGKAVLR